MIIRKYKNHDLTEIIKIIESLPEWLDENARYSIPIDLSFQKCFVFEVDGHVKAFLSYFVYEAIGIIAWIAVEKESRNLGIGSKLINYFEAEMKKYKIKCSQVYTLSDSVKYEPYISTRNFYYKHGYKEYRRIKTENPHCPEELYLRKQLFS